VPTANAGVAGRWSWTAGPKITSDTSVGQAGKHRAFGPDAGSVQACSVRPGRTGDRGPPSVPPRRTSADAGTVAVTGTNVSLQGGADPDPPRPRMAGPAQAVTVTATGNVTMLDSLIDTEIGLAIGRIRPPVGAILDHRRLGLDHRRPAAAALNESLPANTAPVLGFFVELRLRAAALLVFPRPTASSRSGTRTLSSESGRPQCQWFDRGRGSGGLLLISGHSPAHLELQQPRWVSRGSPGSVSVRAHRPPRRPNRPACRTTSRRQRRAWSESSDSGRHCDQQMAASRVTSPGAARIWVGSDLPGRQHRGLERRG